MLIVVQLILHPQADSRVSFILKRPKVDSFQVQNSHRIGDIWLARRVMDARIHGVVVLESAQHCNDKGYRWPNGTSYMINREMTDGCHFRIFLSIQRPTTLPLKTIFVPSQRRIRKLKIFALHESPPSLSSPCGMWWGAPCTIVNLFERGLHPDR